MATSSRRRSVVRRLSTAAALWAVVLGTTLAGVAIWQYWWVSVRAMDARLLADAETLARGIDVTNDVLEVDVPPELVASLATDESYYGIYDANGRLIDGDPPMLGSPGSLAPGTSTVNGYRDVRVPAAAGAVVRVGHSLAPLGADLRRLAASILVASVAASLLALPLTLWLRGVLERSMRQIDRTARALTPGQPARIDLATLDDEFVEVAGRLNDAFDRLERGLERERQLTADASHELRTPVSAILAESDWALSRPRAEDEYRRALQVCRRQGRRLKDLLETLLTLARIEAGAQKPTFTELDLGPLVDQSIVDLSRLAAERHVRVARQGEARARGDRVQIGILLSNLLSNAVRYNRTDGEVHVRLKSRAGLAQLEVQDTGPGLDPAVADRVFDRFWRATSSRSAREGGSGLGLAISKAVVEAHGGQITCETGPEGTTFHVQLPGAGDRGDPGDQGGT
jgi:two-component system, OmpR family, sensor kinase